MSPKVQDRLLVVIEHPVTDGLIDQLIPVPVGRGSDIVTLLAVPWPLLVTVMVNPIDVPALTDEASACLVICRAGHLTWTEADAWTDELLSAEAVAVLL